MIALDDEVESLSNELSAAARQRDTARWPQAL
jgi:hypothetical protein